MNMTEQDYELLSQYLDGELSANARQSLEQRLAAEPKLRASLQRLQALDDTLKSAFSDPAIERAPAGVVALLERRGAQVVTLPRKRAASWGFALAASLVVAVSALLIPRWGADITPSGQAMIDPQLARVLEQVPSSGDRWAALPDGREVRPILSFQRHNGHWCREFMLAGNGSWRGVACRSEGGWVSELLVSEQLAGSSSDYRPAGANDSGRVAQYMRIHATDIALDAEQEAALIANSWQ